MALLSLSTYCVKASCCLSLFVSSVPLVVPVPTTSRQAACSLLPHAFVGALATGHKPPTVTITVQCPVPLLDGSQDSSELFELFVSRIAQHHNRGH